MHNVAPPMINRIKKIGNRTGDTSRLSFAHLANPGGSARISQPSQAYGFVGDGAQSVRSSGGPVDSLCGSAMALPTAIAMPQEAVYLAFMKSMRDPLSESRIADIIDQARGKGPADLVIKSVGIFDLTSGEIRTVEPERAPRRSRNPASSDQHNVPQ